MSIDDKLSNALFDYCIAWRDRASAVQDRVEAELRAAIEQHVAEEVAREREATLNEVLCGLRSERDTDQVRAIIADVEAISARGTT